MREIYVHDRRVQPADVSVHTDEREVALQIGNLRLVGALHGDEIPAIQASREALLAIENAARYASQALGIWIDELQARQRHSAQYAYFQAAKQAPGGPPPAAGHDGSETGPMPPVITLTVTDLDRAAR